MDLEQIKDMLDAEREALAAGDDARLDKDAADRWFASNGVRMLNEVYRLRTSEDRLRAELATACAEVERVTEERDEEHRYLVAFHAEMKTQKARAEKAEAARDEARRTTASQADHIRHLEGELDKAEAEVERLRAENGKLNGYTIYLVDELRSLRTALKALLPDVYDAVSKADETQLDEEGRPSGCQCQWEAGDSPCDVHGEEDR